MSRLYFGIFITAVAALTLTFFWLARDEQEAGEIEDAVEAEPDLGGTAARRRAAEEEPPAAPATRRLRLTGRVVNEAREPLPGVPVFLRDLEVSSEEPAPPRRVSTDEAGRFAFDEDVAARRVEVRARPSAWRDAVVTHDLEGTGVIDLGDLVAPAGCALAGTVTDRAGAPVAGARVSVGRPSRRAIGGMKVIAGLDEVVTRTVETAGDGRFRVDGLEPGRASLTVVAGGYEPAARNDVRLGQAGGAAVREDFVLDEARVVEGTVRSSSGEPIAGAQVRAATRGFRAKDRLLISHTRSATVTDEGGRFRLEALSWRPYELSVFRPGFFTLHRHEISDEETGIDLVLEPAGLIFGHVRDEPTGRPLSDFEIDTTRAWEKERYGLSSVVVHRGADAAQKRGEKGGGEGLFVVDGLTKKDLVLVVTAPGHVGRALKFVGLRSGEERRADVGLRREILISGVVRDESDRPVAGAGVVATRVGGARRNVDAERRLLQGTFSTQPGQLFTDDPRHSRGSRAESDDAGRFTLTGLGPGDYQITARHPDYLDAPPLTQRLEEGYPVDRLVLRLRPGGTVTGRVRDAGGRFLDGVRVQLKKDTDPSAKGEAVRVLIGLTRPVKVTTSHDGGRYVMRAVPPGRYRVFAEPEKKVGHRSDGIPVRVVEGETVVADPVVE